MKEYFGFVYEWTDQTNGMKYIGSHYGKIDDGYVSSNIIMNRVYKKRPIELNREILEFITVNDKKFLLEREQFYLDKIHVSELYNHTNRTNNTVKYYNMKKHAAGGNGIAGSNGKMKNTVKYYHRDTLVQRFFKGDEYISEEWIKGVPSVKTSTGGTKWYTNTSTNEVGRFHVPPSNEWCEGRNQATTPKPVSTPYGVFESASECSRQTGIKLATVTFRCRSETNNMNMWFYIEDNK